MASAIFEGSVRHRRIGPVRHEFRMGLCMLYLDLAEVDEVFRGRWLWSARRPAVARFVPDDYLPGGDGPLDRRVRDLVEGHGRPRPVGPVRLLTHPRYLGYVMNPVSFFYCFDRAGERLETIVAEVSNTPWNERHAYVLGPDEALADRSSRTHRWRFPKRFHVSPFMPMDQTYDWRFSGPGERLVVHMENHEDGRRRFGATMVLRRRAITAAVLRRALVRYPVMTGQVIGRIYLEALRLRLKGCPFHPHPARGAEAMQ